MSETVFYNSKNLVAVGNVGIGTTNPTAPLQVNGGAITNADTTAVKRYSYNGQMPVNTAATITLTFGTAGGAYYAKVTAINGGGGNSNNVSYLAIDLVGGNIFNATAPSVNISIGQANWGGAGFTAWGTISTTPTTVSFTPVTGLSGGAAFSYTIYVELVAGVFNNGKLLSITEGATVVKTFSY